MNKELERVVLLHDMEEYGLKQGDMGVIVHCYKDNKAFEVEFITAKAVVVVTLKPEEIRGR
jgi:hypothetical protein